jgi:hypothetical protein
VGVDHPGRLELHAGPRACGLGSVWTTFHLRQEREAAELLVIPFDEVMQAALIPVAYRVGIDFQPAARWTRWSTGLSGRRARRQSRPTCKAL